LARCLAAAKLIISDRWSLSIGVNDGAAFTTEEVRFPVKYYPDRPPNRYSHEGSAVPRIGRSRYLAAFELKS